MSDVISLRLLSHILRLFQVARPMSMKKDGIQTRKRKPKNSGIKSRGSKTQQAPPTTIAPPPSAGECR